VTYYRRALPHFLKIKELIDAGAIGVVRTVHIDLKQVLKADLLVHQENNWRLDPEVAGGGYFFDLTSHRLDLLDFFFEPILKAKGFSTNQAGGYKAEDMVAATFQFGSGILGTGTWCFAASLVSEVDEISIYGDKGHIKFQNFGKGEFTLTTSATKKKFFELELPKHIQQPLIQTIVDDLLGRGESPSSGISGARTNWVMDEIVWDFQ